MKEKKVLLEEYQKPETLVYELIIESSVLTASEVTEDNNGINDFSGWEHW